MRVTDRKGREIRIGSRVVRSIPGASIPGVITNSGRQVDVTWVTAGGPSCRTYGTERSGFRTRCCPDLELAQQSTKEER